MDAKTVGKNIAKLRREKGLTQKELADALCVIDKTVSRWECGYGLPDISMLPTIAKFFEVPIDAIIGEGNSLEIEKPKKSHKKLIIISSILSFVVIVGIVLVFILQPFNKNKSQTIEAHSWELACQSKADYSLFSMFGNEETLCLELTGNLKEGTFVCTESFYEKTKLDYIDLQIYGDYKIGEDTLGENAICFYSKKIIDPYQTGKMRYEESLGFDYYYAYIESNEAETHDDATYDEINIEGISFLTTEKNTQKSAFGRWTKYSNYFSREPGEVYFSRIKNHEFSSIQKDKMSEDLKRIIETSNKRKETQHLISASV